MATDDTTLMAEVRLLTEYNTAIISDADLTSLVSLAKAELEAKVGVSDLVFYGNPPAERSLFWLTCLFAKIRAGELDGMEMEIGDVRSAPLRVDGEEQQSTAVVWRAEFNSYFSRLLTEIGGAVASRSIARPNRTYGE